LLNPIYSLYGRFIDIRRLDIPLVFDLLDRKRFRCFNSFEGQFEVGSYRWLGAPFFHSLVSLWLDALLYLGHAVLSFHLFGTLVECR
jgi:hypothetical protein